MKEKYIILISVIFVCVLYIGANTWTSFHEMQTEERIVEMEFEMSEKHFKYMERVTELLDDIRVNTRK